MLTTRLLPVLAAVGALALSGCSGSSDDDPTTSAAGSAAAESEDAMETIEAVEPDADATTLAGPGLTVSVPAGWDTADQSGDGLTQLMARGEVEGGSRAALNLVGVPTAESDLDAAVAEVETLGQVRSTTQVTLPQLSTTGPASLVDLDYALEGQAAQAWVLVFEHQDSTYTVTFLAEPFDETLARQTLGTLRDA